MSNLLVINKGAALDRVEGDEELYDEIVGVFLEDTPLQVQKLREGLASDDVPLCHRQSHSLKSSAMNVGAELMSSIAQQMEKAAHGGAMEEVRTLMPTLEKAFEDVVAVLSK